MQGRHRFRGVASKHFPLGGSFRGIPRCLEVETFMSAGLWEHVTLMVLYGEEEGEEGRRGGSCCGETG